MVRCVVVKRRGWDSNPRKVSLQTISSRSLSTTQPPLQVVLLTNGSPPSGRGGAGVPLAGGLSGSWRHQGQDLATLSSRRARYNARHPGVGLAVIQR